MQVFFSVIIPLYNKEKDIENTLKSVLCQTYTNFEIVIVNDGSTDNSASVVQSVFDDRIRLYEHQNNGVSQCRNIAVEKSKGNYIVFLDADDYWYPNHLEQLFKLIKTFPNGKWFATAYELQHNAQLVLPMKCPVMRYGSNWCGEIEDFFANSLVDCMAWTSAVCMSRDFFCELGGFNERYNSGEDIELWIRAALKSNLIFSNNITSRYVLTATNRLTLKPTRNKRHVDFLLFKDSERKNPSLKKYVDLNRYSYALKFKLSGQKKLYNENRKGIDPNSLSKVQLIFLSLPKFALIILYAVKNFLINNNVRIRVPRK